MCAWDGWIEQLGHRSLGSFVSEKWRTHGCSQPSASIRDTCSWESERLCLAKPRPGVVTEEYDCCCLIPVAFKRWKGFWDSCNPLSVSLTIALLFLCLFIKVWFFPKVLDYCTCAVDFKTQHSPWQKHSMYCTCALGGYSMSAVSLGFLPGKGYLMSGNPRQIPYNSSRWD